MPARRRSRDRALARRKYTAAERDRLFDAAFPRDWAKVIGLATVEDLRQRYDRARPEDPGAWLVEAWCRAIGVTGDEPVADAGPGDGQAAELELGALVDES